MLSMERHFSTPQPLPIGRKGLGQSWCGTHLSGSQFPHLSMGVIPLTYRILLGMQETGCAEGLGKALELSTMWAGPAFKSFKSEALASDVSGVFFSFVTWWVWQALSNVGPRPGGSMVQGCGVEGHCGSDKWLGVSVSSLCSRGSNPTRAE